tara:strand:- start:529 stop:792 length:264 start_codon:yes stop_codon:yes gene_type:complete
LYYIPFYFFSLNSNNLLLYLYISHNITPVKDAHKPIRKALVSLGCLKFSIVYELKIILKNIIINKIIEKKSALHYSYTYLISTKQRF